MTTTIKNADPHNVQGDILIPLPKKAEVYYFFRIDENRVEDFRKHLTQLVPYITTTAQLIDVRKKIAETKRQGGGLLKISGLTIAFSHKGLELLGLKDNISPAFNDGMLKGAADLGDAGKVGPDGVFDPDWDPAFKNGVHGVIDITGDRNDTLIEALETVEKVFCVGHPHASIHKVLRLVGHVRPGKEEGHEHFGFLDGVSNPAVDVDNNSVTPLPGQAKVRQGIALLGRDGDEPGSNARPAWSLDGSFLTFRYLPQLVPEFDHFLKANPLPIPGLSPEQGSELLGARMVGRWKSGAPIDVAPTADDPALAADPQRNNDFSFSFPEDPQGQTRCPFAAHVRKTNPRADLTALGIDIENRHIFRRGIQFGPEVSEQEAGLGKTLKERGLLFACYQSSIENGFQFIQQSWANSPAFPINKPADQQPGLDPLIGQNRDPKARVMSGTDSTDPTKNLPLPTWVLSKGGEYFFAPSISTLKDVIAAGGSGGQKDEL